VFRHLALSTGLALIATTLGCSTTLRSMTATAFLGQPGGAAAPADPAAPAPAAGGIHNQYYMTYWEGSCSGMMGCGRGESHVKRCKANPDNTMTCVDEANATKALNPD
jgi:hypothetical protein